MDSNKLPSEFRQLYLTGEQLGKAIQEHLDGFPFHDDKPIQGQFSEELVTRMEELKDRSHRWFNELRTQVLPRTTFERSYINLLLQRLNATIKAFKFFEEYSSGYMVTRDGVEQSVEHNVEYSVTLLVAKNEVKEVIEQGLRLIRTAPATRTSDVGVRTGGHIGNTAFILMWMDKSHPELVDVHQAVKDVFSEFGIKALRADDIEHQDRITDLILNQIAQSEFLFADLSGERPNVYYEVGYAHALGKRPILCRRADTALHFDLAVHNVPEYENVTQLRAFLRQRLEAITGRVPKRSGD